MILTSNRGFAEWVEIFATLGSFRTKPSRVPHAPLPAAPCSPSDAFFDKERTLLQTPAIALVRGFADAYDKPGNDMKLNTTRSLSLVLLSLFAATSWSQSVAPASAAPWKVGTPIVTYYCGPPLTDAAARQMAEGGWNLVWVNEKELDVAQRHGLRGQLVDVLLDPVTLDDPKRRERLDALIARVSKHPALYAYYLIDEPRAAQFPALRKLVAYLRERDPAHLAYINLAPTYARNDQLGIKGDVVVAYQEYLRQYVDIVRPALISYDHYQFALSGDYPQYFLNLAMIRRASLDARVPFLNIVQASSWAIDTMRVPGGDEMRYLVYTTLAYGGQGISYYVYTCADHRGGIATAEGTPTPLYHALKTLNREFIGIAKEIQALRSLGVYHAGMIPKGAEPLPKDAVFTFEPAVPAMRDRPPQRVRGVVLGMFAPGGHTGVASATHAIVVNLDYKSELTVGLRGPGAIEVFDAMIGKWSQTNARRVELKLPRGGGSLVRLPLHAPPTSIRRPAFRKTRCSTREGP